MKIRINNSGKIWLSSVMAGNPNPKTDHLKKHQFKPGQSGNPGGVPKQRKDIGDKALREADNALKRVVELLASTDEKIAMAAAREILDRGVGKPAQVHQGDEEQPIVVEHRITEAQKAFVDRVARLADRDREK